MILFGIHYSQYYNREGIKPKVRNVALVLFNQTNEGCLFGNILISEWYKHMPYFK